MIRPATFTERPWQPAQLVRDQLLAYQAQQQRTLSVSDRTISEPIRRLEDTQRKLRKAGDRGYNAAARKLVPQLELHIADLSFELQRLRQNVIRQAHQKIPSLADIVCEFNQLQDEFGEWEYRPRHQVISVRTEPITLEGTYLGPFAIELEIAAIDDLDQRAPYSVIAIDPHPAAGNSAVHHPHVNDRQLCPGDAAPAIRQALIGGRLADFFVMIRAILLTYNDQSPYVSLDDWHGVSCNECGYRVSDEYRFFCEACRNNYCDTCISRCRCCDESVCGGCLEPCEGCDHACCNECLSSCDECDGNFCSRCLVDGLCPDCLEQKENQDDENPETEPSLPTTTQHV